MPAALIRLIQTESNKSFHQAFTSHLLVRWTHFIPLIFTLTTGNFHLGTLTMPGGLRHSLKTAITIHQTASLPHKTSTTVHRGGEAYTTTSQVAV